LELYRRSKIRPRYDVRFALAIGQPNYFHKTPRYARTGALNDCSTKKKKIGIRDLYIDKHSIKWRKAGTYSIAAGRR
jgi:hypothetical protein